MSEVNLTIKCSNADKTNIKIELSATVLDLKVKISEVLSVPASQQRLIYKGRVLKDDSTLENYDIQDEHTVHMVKGSAPSTTNQPASSSSIGSSAGNMSYSAPPPSAQSTNPMANMFGAGGFGGTTTGAGAPDMSRMHEQLMRNPEMMQQIMNSPMMENLLNNPDMIRNMMVNNPQMQQMLDANPQMRHILNDPAVLRQSMEMMRNPNAMQQAMRNQDLQMSQIENIPGGFNALRRMFEEVQEPMMEASQNMNSTANASSSSISNSSNNTSSIPTNTALPNPWGATATPNSASAFPGTSGMNNPFAFLPPPNNNTGMYGSGSSGGGGMNPNYTNPYIYPPPTTGMPGGMDPTQMANMMQNPMMQQMLSDPNALNQLSMMNPQLGAMMQNPQMRAMMQNPEFLRTLSNPSTMQAIMQMQQSGMTMPPMGGGFPNLGYGYGGYSDSGGMQNNPYAFNMPFPPSTSSNSSNTNGLNFDSLFNNTPLTTPPISTTTSVTGSTTASTSTLPPPPDPSIRYANQLQQLQDMGFSDNTANLQALVITNGNVNSAVERLLSGSI